MKRSLGVERTYTLGDYKNLRVSDYINDIPEELMLNDEFVSSVRLLQLMRLDAVYYEYQKNTATRIDNISAEEALEYIDKLTLGTSEKLYKTVASLEEEPRTAEQMKEELGY